MTKEKLMKWLQNRVAESLSLSPDDIKIDEPLEQYGLGSKENLLISGDLEELLDRDLPHTILWDYPTINALSSHLLGKQIPERSATSTFATNEPIAIIGIGCRFPGASNPQQFWQMLINGEDQIVNAPKGRWPSTESEKDPIQYGAFLPRIDQFDPTFFGISPREAELMDPQQRILLEVTWEALEDAGLRIADLKGTNTSVYMGVSGNDYTDLLTKEPDFHYLTGNSFSIVANRISYVMDWYGPSMTIDTACSSSLVAVDLACQSLRSGQSSLSFVGGVNLMVTPSNSMRFADGGVLALDGKCKTFDASADGYVRGEGAGVVVLKPLSQAKLDNNHIYAVIHGSAVNQDGRSNGLTAPNVHAQKTLLQTATHASGIESSDVFYVEAHGTGTPLGDPIEVRALAEAYATERNSSLYLGSVKTNIGHLEAAAGIAGLIKTALSIQKRQIPPHLHFKQWNPQIPTSMYPLKVVTRTIDIPNHAYLGVSSFGFGGTNAHVILGEGPFVSEKVSTNSNGYEYTLLPISAKNHRSLQANVSRYRQYLQDTPMELPAISSHAWFKKDHYDERIVLVAQSKDEAIQLLSMQEKQQKHENLFYTNKNKADRIIFVFSGQGPKLSTTEELFQTEPVFRQTILEIDAMLSNTFSWSLQASISSNQNSDTKTIVETQMLSFSIQVALAKMWISWGITPSSIVGHSLGEVAAAYIAGALQLHEAIEVVAQRSYYAEKMVGRGRLLVAQMNKDTAERLVHQSENKISISVYNSPTSYVLSGDSKYLDKIKTEMDTKGVFSKYLETIFYPSHSTYMREIEEELYQSLMHIKPTKTIIPFVSTVTGSILDGDQLHARYWCDNICMPVRFQDAMNILLQEEKSLFLEISAHPTLLHSMLECADQVSQSIQVLPSLERGQSCYFRLFATLAELYCSGFLFDLDSVIKKVSVKRLSLPTYSWDHQRYWIDPISPQDSKLTEKEKTTSYLKLERIDDYVIHLISTTLKIPVHKMPMNKPIIHLGLDSILAMRVKSRVEQDLDIKISIVPILQGCSIEDLIKSISR